MEVSGELHAPGAVHLQKESSVPMGRRLGGTQSQSRLLGGRISRSVSPQSTQGTECTIAALCLFSTRI